MAAPLLRKLLNRPSPLRFLVTSLLNNPSTSAPLALLLPSHDKLDVAEKPSPHHLGSLDNVKIPFSESCRIYPSFAFGSLLNLSQSLCSGEDETPNETQTIWADSVKKKRKKKMNKHKYKKLRKRLRRKTVR